MSNTAPQSRLWEGARCEGRFSCDDGQAEPYSTEVDEVLPIAVHYVLRPNAPYGADFITRSICVIDMV